MLQKVYVHTLLLLLFLCRFTFCWFGRTFFVACGPRDITLKWREFWTAMIQFNVYWTVHRCNSWRMKDQLDVTCYFISLIMCSTYKLQQGDKIHHTKHTTTHRKVTLMLKHPSLQNKTTDVVIHQHSRKLLKMDILMSETSWAHKKWNKIARDIKLVFHSSTTAMMHGPIYINPLAPELFF